MADKWCPAGKIECEHFKTWPGSAWFSCSGGPDGKNSKSLWSYAEQCPWPSRQQPIQQQKIIKLELTEYGRGWKEGFAAGRAEGMRECRVALNDRLKVARLNGEDAQFRNGIICAHATIAALEGVKEEK
jgi:hypothetical protein